MAIAQDFRAVEHGIVERITAMVSRAHQRWTQNRVYRKTYNELSALDARALADLGVHRSAIRQIAYEAAYGK